MESTNVNASLRLAKKIENVLRSLEDSSDLFVSCPWGGVQFSGRNSAYTSRVGFSYHGESTPGNGLIEARNGRYQIFVSRSLPSVAENVEIFWLPWERVARIFRENGHLVGQNPFYEDFGPRNRGEVGFVYLILPDLFSGFGEDGKPIFIEKECSFLFPTSDKWRRRKMIFEGENVKKIGFNPELFLITTPPEEVLEDDVLGE